MPLVVGALTLLLLAFGLTGATATSGTTGVAITPLTPTKLIATGASVAAGKTYTFVASGGTSTVPSNALVVELAITAKGTKAGTVSFAPLGEPGNGSPTTVSWAAGGSGAGTVRVNVGNSNKVVVTNSSAASATLGVKITGYSTLVSAAGISGVGGGDGQVLTNQGNGTVGWESLPEPEPVPVVHKVHVKSTGVVDLGTATVSRPSAGVYVLTGIAEIRTCAVTGSVGAISGDVVVTNAIVSTSISPNFAQATVQVRLPSNAPVDSAFFLTLVC
ncbi:hypothetical protein [Nocardioides sp. WS12]|uniref:hypothetical protein n=1 Tax=Nocardioides sp. WS12 TaxID=2486272 RepID=UPI0015FE141C|nr:hypothetical protein [Nocardioides sp. WS12]